MTDQTAGSGDDYLQRNMAGWTSMVDREWGVGRRGWAAPEPHWGVFGVPESEVRLLPVDLEGKDIIEIGCGTGYVSSWLARRGGRPVGMDPTASQLAIAGALQSEFGLSLPLVRAAGEALPFADGSFDLAISEYGAAIWADPYAWIPEASRVLRPGGELIFLGNSTLMMLCVPDEAGVPAGAHLVRPQFGMHRFEWPDDDTIEFHLSPGEWIRLLRANRFEIEDLIEIRPPAQATTTYDFVTLEWARSWPCEEVWRARRRPD